MYCVGPIFVKYCPMGNTINGEKKFNISDEYFFIHHAMC